MSKTRIQALYERRAAVFNRKALQYGVRGRVTAEQLVVMPLECAYCHIGLGHEHSDFDHQLPLSRGGANSVENIVRCCGQCNGRKFTKTAAEHVAFESKTFLCVVCNRQFRPRYADTKRNYGRVCSRQCAGRKRWMNELDENAAGSRNVGGDVSDAGAPAVPARTSR